MRNCSNRRVGSRNQYKILVIVCEGTKTERTYFNHYRERGRDLKIETPNTSKTDPVGLVRFAKHQISRLGMDFEHGDQVWCVFDVDHNDDSKIKAAVTLAAPDIRIVLSNPSFELWYLLHFRYCETRLTNTDLLEKLRGYIRGYEKRMDVFTLLTPKKTTAISNAKRLNTLHEKNSVELLSARSNPSTQVYRIVESIANLTNRFN